MGAPIDCLSDRSQVHLALVAFDLQGFLEAFDEVLVLVDWPLNFAIIDCDSLTPLLPLGRIDL